MSDLLSRAMPGSQVPDVEVRGVQAHGRSAENGMWKQRRQKTWQLSRLRRDTYIMFYDEECSSCQDNIASAERLMSADRKMRVLFVKMQPEEALLDSFDLTSLPYIIRVDKNGIITARYVDFTRLERNTFGGKRN